MRIFVTALMAAFVAGCMSDSTTRDPAPQAPQGEAMEEPTDGFDNETTPDA